MSKQSNQRYRKEVEPEINENPDNRANNLFETINDMPSREGYGDGNPDGSSDNNTKSDIRNKTFI
ncbi:MAG: hypothetical protein GX288_03865 [Clostridiales bacterium]|jgi:hypothetical protein|nr:hypothetical protein [Clostridiales bacterium]